MRRSVNLFRSSNKTDRLNIVTGEKAIFTDLVNAKSKGIQAMKRAEENGADAVRPPELFTFTKKVKKPAESQTLIKIYQDETAVTKTLCFFYGADEETRCKAFSHEWTDYSSSLFETVPRLTHGYTMWKGCESDFVKALLSQVNETFKAAKALDRMHYFSVCLMSFVKKYKHVGVKTFRHFRHVILQNSCR